MPLKIYLAGPEVFLPNAREMLDRKAAMARAAGFTPLSPGDLKVEKRANMRDFAYAISEVNERMMLEAGAIIANLTPWRGIAADVGTVYELGFMCALDKIVYAYTNIARTLFRAHRRPLWRPLAARCRRHAARARRTGNGKLRIDRQSDASRRRRAARRQGGRWQRPTRCHLHRHRGLCRMPASHRGTPLMNTVKPKIVRTVAALRRETAAWRINNHRYAVVPTMGALHEGHLALVREGLARAERVVVTIFVNPKQFGANEDLSRYPRDEEGDVAKLAEAGAHLIFAPLPGEVYPGEFRHGGCHGGSRQGRT